MTTTIAPSIGAAPLFTQQGVGTTPGYSAIDDRRADSAGLQEGVLGQGASAQDFMVQQRLAGAAMSVEITMPAGGGAMVQGDSVTGQGLYYVPVHSANIIETISANASGSPRIDSIILEVLDNVHDASGNNLVRTRVLTGTPTGGTTLDSGAGRPTLPGSALLLADVLVANGAASITNSVIRDRRKWARGAYRTATSSTTFNTTSGTASVVSSTYAYRIECGTGIVRCVFDCDLVAAVAAKQGTITAMIDGVEVGLRRTDYLVTAGNIQRVTAVWEFPVSAGSHVLAPGYFSNDGVTQVSVWGTANNQSSFTVEEILRQNAVNNSVTTG